MVSPSTTASTITAVELLLLLSSSAVCFWLSTVVAGGTTDIHTCTMVANMYTNHGVKKLLLHSYVAIAILSA